MMHINLNSHLVKDVFNSLQPSLSYFAIEQQKKIVFIAAAILGILTISMLTYLIQRYQCNVLPIKIKKSEERNAKLQEKIILDLLRKRFKKSELERDNPHSTFDYPHTLSSFEQIILDNQQSDEHEWENLNEEIPQIIAIENSKKQERVLLEKQIEEVKKEQASSNNEERKLEEIADGKIINLKKKLNECVQDIELRASMIAMLKSRKAKLDEKFVNRLPPPEIVE